MWPKHSCHQERRSVSSFLVGWARGSLVSNRVWQKQKGSSASGLSSEIPVLGALSCYGRNHPRASSLWGSARHREKAHVSPAVPVFPVQAPTWECKRPSLHQYSPSSPPHWGPRHLQADSGGSPWVPFRHSWPTGSISLIKSSPFSSTKFGGVYSAAVLTRTPSKDSSQTRLTSRFSALTWGVYPERPQQKQPSYSHRITALF